MVLHSFDLVYVDAGGGNELRALLGEFVVEADLLALLLLLLLSRADHLHFLLVLRSSMVKRKIIVPIIDDWKIHFLLIDSTSF